MARTIYGAVVGGGIGGTLGVLDFEIAGGFMLAGRFFDSPGSEAVLAACCGAIIGGILGWSFRADLGGIGFLLGLIYGVVPGGLAIGRNVAGAGLAARERGAFPFQTALGPWSELPTTALLLIYGGLAGWLLGSLVEWITDRCLGATGRRGQPER